MELDEIYKRLAEVESLKAQAIEQLLAKRADIDAQLAKLGYGTTVTKAPGPKRKRRTKAEIEADEAAKAKPEQKARLVKKEAV